MKTERGIVITGDFNCNMLNNESNNNVNTRTLLDLLVDLHLRTYSLINIIIET
jgi:hypothetical protein